jgi:hypothetical protein
MPNVELEMIELWTLGVERSAFACHYGDPLPATFHTCDLYVVLLKNTKEFSFLPAQHAGENEPITPF